MVPARPAPTPPSEDDSPWLTSQQAAAMLGVQRASLYAYVSRGLLRAHSQPGTRGHVYARIDVQRLARQRQTVRNPAQLARSTLDWGTPVLRSAITQVSQGQLYYRGRHALQWAQHASLEDTAALLLDQPIAAAPPSAPMPGTAGTEGTAAATQPVPQPRPPEQALRAWHSLPANEPTLAHSGWPRPLLQQMLEVLTGWPATDTATSAAGRLIHQQLAALWQVDAAGEDTLRQALVLCADHELNASSFAARVVASTGASLHASLGAGLAALSGPLHGGMTAVIDRHWDAWHAAPQADGTLPPSLAQLLADTRINGSPHYCAGFGHPLYPAGDPRSERLLRLLPADAARSALLAQFDYDYPRMRDSGFGWPVVDMRLKYVRPAAFGQRLKIKASITEWENRLRIDYLIRDAHTGEKLNSAYTIQVAVDMQTREMRFVCPPVLWERLGVAP